MNEATLKDVAVDVAYEMYRYSQAVRLFASVSEDQGKRLILEAQLLHLRILMDFFYTESDNPDDVQAVHFFSDPEHWKPSRPNWYFEYRDRCNKLLSHLTYSRVTKYKDRGRMGWTLDDKCAHFQQVWNQFLSALPPGRRAWFRYSEGQATGS
jgi:hypothetical protein